MLSTIPGSRGVPSFNLLASVTFLYEPSMLQLDCRFLPANLSILGYARSKLSKKDLQEKVKPNLKGDEDMIDEFLDVLDYEAGPYDKPDGYQKVAVVPQYLPS